MAAQNGGFVLVSRSVSGGLRWADVDRTGARAWSNHARPPPVVDRAWSTGWFKAAEPDSVERRNGPLPW